MNDNRRARIQKLRDQIEDLKEQIDYLQTEEQDAFDNMPEGLQGSDKGQAIETAADHLSDAVSSMEDVITSLESAAE
jgi:predicted  nucleic acid-binding Zn-ribbon protein